MLFTSQRKNGKENMFHTYIAHGVLQGRQSSSWPRTESRSYSLQAYLIVAWQLSFVVLGAPESTTRNLYSNIMIEIYVAKNRYAIFFVTNN